MMVYPPPPRRSSSVLKLRMKPTHLELDARHGLKLGESVLSFLIFLSIVELAESVLSFLTFLSTG